MIVGDAGEIAGEGFKPVRSDDRTLSEIMQSLRKGRSGGTTEENTEKGKADGRYAACFSGLCLPAVLLAAVAGLVLRVALCAVRAVLAVGILVGTLIGRVFRVAAGILVFGIVIVIVHEDHPFRRVVWPLCRLFMRGRFET